MVALEERAPPFVITRLTTLPDHVAGEGEGGSTAHLQGVWPGRGTAGRGCTAAGGRGDGRSPETASWHGKDQGELKRKGERSSYQTHTSCKNSV